MVTRTAIIILLFMILVPLVSILQLNLSSYLFAAIVPECPEGQCTFQDFATVFDNFMSNFLKLAYGLALILVLAGSFLYMFGGTNQKMAERGRMMITYAIIGFIIILSSAIIIDFILEIFQPELAPTGFNINFLVYAQNNDVERLYNPLKENIATSVKCGTYAENTFQKIWDCTFEAVDMLKDLALILLALAIIISGVYLIGTPMFGSGYVEKAKKVLIWSAIGFVIIFSADLIRQQIEAILRTNQNQQNQTFYLPIPIVYAQDNSQKNKCEVISQSATFTDFPCYIKDFSIEIDTNFATSTLSCDVEAICLPSEFNINNLTAKIALGGSECFQNGKFNKDKFRIKISAISYPENYEIGFERAQRLFWPEFQSIPFIAVNDVDADQIKTNVFAYNDLPNAWGTYFFIAAGIFKISKFLDVDWLAKDDLINYKISDLYIKDEKDKQCLWEQIRDNKAFQTACNFYQRPQTCQINYMRYFVDDKMVLPPNSAAREKLAEVYGDAVDFVQSSSFDFIPCYIVNKNKAKVRMEVFLSGGKFCEEKNQFNFIGKFMLFFKDQKFQKVDPIEELSKELGQSHPSEYFVSTDVANISVGCNYFEREIPASTVLIIPSGIVSVSGGPRYAFFQKESLQISPPFIIARSKSECQSWADSDFVENIYTAYYNREELFDINVRYVTTSIAILPPGIQKTFKPNGTEGIIRIEDLLSPDKDKNPVIGFIFNNAPLVLVILIMLGGFFYLLSPIKSPYIEKGRKIIFYAIVGYLFILISIAVFNLIKSLFNVII